MCAVWYDVLDFQIQSYVIMVLVENQWFIYIVFVQNDWEKWYGEDKKCFVGSFWVYIFVDGGRWLFVVVGGDIGPKRSSEMFFVFVVLFFLVILHKDGVGELLVFY